MALRTQDTGDGGDADPIPPDEDPATHRWGARTVAATALVIALYLALAVVAYWHAWMLGPSDHLQSGGDQIATVWFLRWVPFSLAHGHNPFFSTYGNYPFGVNLLTNTSVPLLGLVGAPVTLLFGPVATYNMLLTAALAGSATAGYFFVRPWVTWRPAAFVGGLVYGFSPYQIAQSYGGHLNLTFVVLPPLILLTGRRLWTGTAGSRVGWGVLLGVLVAGQYLISSEVLASTLVMAAVCVVAALVVGGRSLRPLARTAIRGASWAMGVAAVLLAYPIWFTLRGPGHIAGPIQLVPEAYRADLLGPLVPSLYLWLAPAGLVKVADGFANNTAENGSYLGITLLATLAVGTVWLWRKSAALRVAAIAGAVAFVLSLGGGLVVRRPPGAALTGLPLPERIFTRLPLLSNTVPVRYSLYVALFASVVLALVLDRSRTRVAARLAGRRSGPSVDGSGPAPSPRAVGRRRPATLDPGSIAAWLVAIVCLVPLIPDLPVAGIVATTTPAYFTSAALAATPAGRVSVLFPYPSSSVPSGQLWQAEAAMHFRTPGGYYLVPQGPLHHIAYSPVIPYAADTLTARVLDRVFAGTPPAETAGLRTALLAQFHSWHVSDLVASLSAVPDPATSLRFLTWLMGGPPVRALGIQRWNHVPGGG